MTSGWVSLVGAVDLEGPILVLGFRLLALALALAPREPCALEAAVDFDLRVTGICSFAEKSKTPILRVQEVDPKHKGYSWFYGGTRSNTRELDNDA